MKVLVHIEQYDVVGVLPSQLESLALLNQAMRVEDAAYVDGTPDGVKNANGFKRYGSLQDFLAHEKGPFIAFSPSGGEDIRKIRIPKHAWLLFGPSMGFTRDSFGSTQVTWATVPGGVMNSRDIVPIALWQTSLWQAR